MWRVAGPLRPAPEPFWRVVGDIFSAHYSEARTDLPAGSRAPNYTEHCLCARAGAGATPVAAAKAESFTGGVVVKALAVAPDARRRGVGAAVLAALLARAYSAGARVATAEAASAGGAALLQRAGFAADFVRPNWGAPGASRTIFSRALTGDDGAAAAAAAAHIAVSDASPFDGVADGMLAELGGSSSGGGGAGGGDGDFAFAALRGDASGADADDIIGCCAGTVDASNALRVGVLVVRAAWRRRGVGAALLERAEALAAARGCHAIALETFDFQAPAFYAARGYGVDFSQGGWQAGAQLQYYSKRLARAAQ